MTTHENTPATLTGLTFRVQASQSRYDGSHSVTISCRNIEGRFTGADRRNAALAISRPLAQLFPKYVKLQGTTLSTFDDEGSYDAPYLTMTVGLGSTGVTGAKNETGLKRLNAALRTISKLGGSWEYDEAHTNVTREQFLALLTEA